MKKLLGKTTLVITFILSGCLHETPVQKEPEGDGFYLVAVRGHCRLYKEHGTGIVFCECDSGYNCGTGR